MITNEGHQDVEHVEEERYIHKKVLNNKSLAHLGKWTADAQCSLFSLKSSSADKLGR
jgi:hypothetical protein